MVDRRTSLPWWTGCHSVLHSPSRVSARSCCFASKYCVLPLADSTRFECVFLLYPFLTVRRKIVPSSNQASNLWALLFVEYLSRFSIGHHLTFPFEEYMSRVLISHRISGPFATCFESKSTGRGRELFGSRPFFDTPNAMLEWS